MSDVEDMEHITPGDIPPPTALAPPTPEHMSSEERLYRSDYAQVLFHNIAEAYQTGSDIECCYTITALLEPMPRDWVGIYKVGWSSVRDYVCFNWSPMPVDYKQMKDARNRLTFQASSVPREDGEFYQFCYVTARGLVRGASTPFQFRAPGMDDYVEVEEDDIMVVKTRTSALEDDLKTVLVAKEKLIERSRMLELERDGLLGKLVEYDSKMGSVKKERDMLAKIVEDCKGKLDGVRTSNKELEDKHSNVLDALKQLTSNRDAVVCKLADKEGEMRLLQDRVIMLTKDNDIATGTNQTLIEQKELFEHHFTTSESRLVAYQRERDDRKKQISVLEEMCASQREDIIRFKTDAEKLKCTVDRQQSNGRSDLAKIDALTEQLRNAEDKLCAAEHCKKLLNDEMAVLDQAQQKASSNLEESRSEVHMLKGQLTKMEAQQKHENEMISDEVSKCQVMLQEENKEKERLAELLQQSNEQMREFVIDRLPEKEAALQILQDAQRDLKKQFARLEGRAGDMGRRLERMHHEKCEWQQRESELTQEIGDLKERLLMGQDEYKMQFVECAQAKRQLSRLHKSAATRVTESPERIASSQCEKEVQVTTGGDYTETNVDDNCSQTDADPLKMADLSSPEIQEQLTELGRELEARNDKKNRYKNLFYEERRKNALLQQHYFDQLQKKDEESKRMMAAINPQMDRRNYYDISVCAPKMDVANSDEARPQLHPGKATAGAVESDYPDDMGPLKNIPHGLTAPMTPLPPPISPEVLPSAKVAAVKAAVLSKATVIPTLLGAFDEAVRGMEYALRCSDHAENSDQTSVTMDDARPASYTSEKTCPVCNGIMGDLTEAQMTEHVNSHYSQECPMCNHIFPQDYDKEAFRQHVEQHFSEDT